MTRKGIWSFGRGLCSGCALIDIWQAPQNPRIFAAFAVMMALCAVWYHALLVKEPT